ncbi:MAG: invasin domain 3-containing protein [bacterium]
MAYAGDVFSFNTTVQNLIGQKLGTTDGITLDPTGVRVFFYDAPHATSGSGTIDFIDPVGGGSLVDGFATFTASNQPYYQYNQILATSQTSAPKQWRIHIPASVTTFAFGVYVSAPVQFPTGWIDVAPPTATLKAAATQALTATVRDVVGRTVTGQTVTWGTSNAAVATVDVNSGLVTAVADGAATITATSTTRTGTAAITVSTAAGSTTTITGAPTPLAVASPATITVQAKNAAGVNMTVGGDVVVLNASLGTLSAVTDNNNGTYTATLNSNTAGTSSITGTINGATIGTPGSVTFTAGTVSGLAINAGDAQTANVSAAVGTLPSVLATDTFGNPVPGVTVTFSVTGGGGSGTVLSAVTNASGIATVGSWTLGAGGAGCAAATITNCSRNALHAVATGGPNPAVDFKAYIPPIVPTATYQAVGNSTLPIAANIGLLLNAFSINGNGANGTGATLSVPTTSATGSASGSATIASNGSFSYLSAPAYLSVGAATEDFTFAVSDGIAATPAAGTLQVNVPTRVWYVQPGYGGTSTGSNVQPYKDLSLTAGTGVESAAPAGETILVFAGSGTAAGGTLKATQTLYGQGASAPNTFTTGSAATYRNGGLSLTLLSPGQSPLIGALTLANSNTLTGVTLTGLGGTALSGTSFGTLTVTDAGINTTNQALSLTTGTVSGGFTQVTSSGGTNNILLSSVSTTGTLGLGTPADALSGATGDALAITGGAGSFTYSGSITNASTLAVNITSKSGGTVTISGDINPAAAAKGISVSGNNSGTNTIIFSGANKKISAGTGVGVNLATNTGATISFTNGGLAIATTTGIPFGATGGGTVEVTGSGNTVSATGAAANAVNMNGVTIGASGITFASVASSGTTTASSMKAISVANISGSVFTTGSLTVAGTTGATSRGIELTSNSAPFTFTTASVNGTGGEGIYLNGNSGAVAINGGSVGNTSNPTGDALFVTGGSAAVTVAAALTKTNAGRIANFQSRTGGTSTVPGNLACSGTCTGVLVNGNSGGTIDFSGATKTISPTGSSVGVTVTGNAGSTVNFSNGGLAVTTSTGNAFLASGGGTVTVTTGSSNNTLTSTLGTALSVSSTSIGSSGMTFRSISASGGANGIFLSSTGIAGGDGGLTVTGDGGSASNGSGGTITNMVGADGATSGVGIYLSTTKAPSLNYINLSGHQNHGIFGTGVRGGLSMNKVRLTGTNGDSNNGGGTAFNESSLRLDDIGGPVKIQNSRFDGAAMNAIRIDNSIGTAPTLDSLVFDTDSVTTMQGSTADVRGTALLVTLMDGTADVRIRNSFVTAWWGNAIHVLAQGTASATTRILNNFVDNTNGALAGAGGIWVVGGNHTYRIANNTVRHTNGTAISADRVNFGTNMNGTIDSNTIGVTGDNNSGSTAGLGIFASHHGPNTTTVKIANNSIRQVSAATIGVMQLLTGDAVGFGGSGTFNATVVSNTLAESGTNTGAAPAIAAHMAMLYTVGSQSGPPTDTDVACFDVGGAGGLVNTITGINTGFGGASPNRIRVNQRFGTTSRWPGYGGAVGPNAPSTTDMAAYLLGRNTASNSTNANTSTGGFNNTAGGAACTQPTNLP